jgi:hypothetical protein
MRLVSRDVHTDLSHFGVHFSEPTPAPDLRHTRSRVEPPVPRPMIRRCDARERLARSSSQSCRPRGRYPAAFESCCAAILYSRSQTSQAWSGPQTTQFLHTRWAHARRSPRRIPARRTPEPGTAQGAPSDATMCRRETACRRITGSSWCRRAHS